LPADDARRDGALRSGQSSTSPSTAPFTADFAARRNRAMQI
jgi:hypothetical protein